MTEPSPEAPTGGAPAEERPSRREPVFNLPRVVVVFIAICTIVHLVRLYAIDAEQDFVLVLHAAFIPVRYEYVLDFFAFSSPVTYSLLHGSLPHLAVNMIWLAAFGSPLANRIGAARFVLFWIAASLAAALLHYALHSGDDAPLVGASGAISGMMGAAARFGFRIDRSSGQAAFGGPVLPIARVLSSRGTVSFLAVWMVINLLTGLLDVVPGGAGQIAWEAHIGGFAVGFFLIGVFDAGQRSRRA